MSPFPAAATRLPPAASPVVFRAGIDGARLSLAERSRGPPRVVMTAYPALFRISHRGPRS
jgi:hypothetical protein